MLAELHRATERLTGVELTAEIGRLVSAPRFAFHHTEDGDEDAVSHFALRIAMAGDPHWREHFLRGETMFFRARLGGIRDPGVLPRMMCGHRHRVVAHADLAAPIAALLAALHGPAPAAGRPPWIVVPWHRAGRLVDRREVLLVAGEAYVPPRRLATVLEAAFRRLQSGGMAAASRRLADLRATPGAEPVVELFVAVTRPDADFAATGAVRLNDIEDMGGPAFPLCVRAMDRHLRTHGRIDHAGRWQMGLFLKAGRAPVAKAEQYFARRPGTGIAPSVRMRYAYNVRHLYGLEGARRGYDGLVCTAVIRSPPPTSTQCHGCPFALWSADRLSAELTTVDGLTPAAATELVERRKESPMAACAGLLASRLGAAAAEDFLTHPAPHRYLPAPPPSQA